MVDIKEFKQAVTDIINILGRLDIAKNLVGADKASLETSFAILAGIPKTHCLKCSKPLNPDTAWADYYCTSGCMYNLS